MDAPLYFGALQISIFFLGFLVALAMDAPLQPSAGGGSWSYDWLLNSRQIKPSVQRHLKMVYLTLWSFLVASAVGVYLQILFNVSGIITIRGCFLSTAILMNISPCEKRKRLGFLMAAAVFEGASIGPLFEPRIILIGFVGTSLACACFFGAVMMAKRREFFYLGGFFSAWFSIHFWLHIASFIFGPSAVMFNFELYLLIFLGIIVLYTEAIIERDHHGDLDYVKHALTLCTDLYSFVNFASS